MKEITTSKGTFLFVEVPDDAANISMSSIGNLHYDHSFEGGVLNMHQMHIVDLFDTSLKFICTTKNATEEQAEMVVDSVFDYCELSVNVSGDGFDCVGCNADGLGDCAAKMTHPPLACLVKWEGLNTKNNYAIIQKL
jgi:hypothetical protein